MSHATGLIRFKKDGKIGCYEYDGTSDVAISHWYETMEEVSDNWRKGEWMTCTCGESEPVTIYSSYANGFCFEGTACRKCKSINHDIDFDSSDDTKWVDEYYKTLQ